MYTWYMYVCLLFPYSSRAASELSLWLCYDDSTINIVVVIIIIIIIIIIILLSEVKKSRALNKTPSQVTPRSSEMEFH